MKFTIGQQLKMTRPIKAMEDYLRPGSFAKVLVGESGIYTLDIGSMVLIADAEAVEECFEEVKPNSTVAPDYNLKAMLELHGLNPNAGWAEVFTSTRIAIRDAKQLTALKETLVKLSKV